MDEEQKVEDVAADDPFAPDQEPPVPWFWLGLLMIPIVTTMLATGFRVLEQNRATAEAEAAPVAVVEVLDRAEAPQTQISSEPSGERPVYARKCDFDLIIGRTMTKSLHESLRSSKRLIRMVRDEGQSLPRGNPARVTLYLNDQNVITRVVCG